MLKLLIYYCFDDTNKSALITLHTLMCRIDNFHDVMLDTHKFTLSNFDDFIKAAKANFKACKEGEKWDDYVNVCASITGFVGCFQERSEDFQEIIVPLIRVCSDKIDRVRKNSAVLMAKLAMNENNKRLITANHGMEVLMSLQGQLL